MKKIVTPYNLLFFIGLCFFQLIRPAGLPASAWQDQVRSYAGDGSVLVVRIGGPVILAVNPDKPLIPASIFKLVTCAAAMEYLGPEYRFLTEFRLDANSDLYVIGHGDPYLVSEELAWMTAQLKARGLKQVRDIVLVDSYFATNGMLSGNMASLNPYDAYNGALRVNFNTIFVRIDSQNRVFSAEPQTPLTDFARIYALKSGLRGTVRINLADNPETGLLYSGHLLREFLKAEEIQTSGTVRRTTVPPADVPVFWRHYSRQDLVSLVPYLLHFSNNFMTNQIFLTMGAERAGPPADEKKAGRVLSEYLRAIGVEDVVIHEGSGLSRLNRITARQMSAVLERFQPYHRLLPSQDQAWKKTGTLSDVKSMAGYIKSEQGDLFSFVIMLNGDSSRINNRDKIFSLLLRNLM